jgi:hypothetical protein
MEHTGHRQNLRVESALFRWTSLASPVVHDERTVALLARYVAAWETTDVDALVSLLREDATLAMPLP